MFVATTGLNYLLSLLCMMVKVECHLVYYNLECALRIALFSA